jgi:hypothetical protein
MSIQNFNYDQPYVVPKDYRVDPAPALLDGGVALSAQPDFIFTQVDRAYYGSLAGGTGRWGFGYFRTPQRWMIDTLNGWDPDVAKRPDPHFNPTNAKTLYEAMPLGQRVAVEWRGGQELVNDIINNSVSPAHLDQRMREITAVVKAQMAIERYDRESYMLGYGAQKVFSGIVNYVTVDPLTTISIIAAAGLAARSFRRFLDSRRLRRAIPDAAAGCSEAGGD